MALRPGLLGFLAVAAAIGIAGFVLAARQSSAASRSGRRNVPTSEKHAVEVEYGMAPKSYGRTIEIDHIVSLELGGSNDIANLYPEPQAGESERRAIDRLRL